MNEIRLNNNEYISVNESGKITIQCKNKFVEFESLEEMISYLKPGAFSLLEIKNKLSNLKFENNEIKLFMARCWEYECLEDLYVVVARNIEEAELLFDKFLIENYENIECAYPEEVTEENEDYEELLEEYGSKEVGVYEW